MGLTLELGAQERLVSPKYNQNGSNQAELGQKTQFNSLSCLFFRLLILRL